MVKEGYREIYPCDMPGNALRLTALGSNSPGKGSFAMNSFL